MDRPTTTGRRWLRRTAVGALATACGLAVFACSDRDVVMLGHGSGSDGGPAFISSSDAEVGEAEAELRSYCPSNRCPADFTTCPTSRFPCDVDLKRDRNNCGACGHACPAANNRDAYECIDGRCELQCGAGSRALNCDGIDENGCETSLGSDEHCTACGDKCSDPAKPCVVRNPRTSEYGCGCAPDQLYCNGQCVNPRSSDFDCGGCGNVCDRNGDAGAPPPNAYYGCGDGECGRLKCNPGYRDCDGDPSNGCETSLRDPKSCGGCGHVCGPGQQCRAIFPSQDFECACPAGKSWCDAFCVGNNCVGACRDLSSDPLNCGGCGVKCGDDSVSGISGICTYGVCNLVCPDGKADCNGNPSDGCEVNIDSDPQNCGGCGQLCDAVAGQACVRGRCVVEPCDQIRPDGGGETR